MTWIALAALVLLTGSDPAAAGISPQEHAASASSPCVAILLPNIQGIEGDAVQVASGIQQLFSSYLSGPSIRVLTLEARLPSLAAEEAQQKHCDHILQATFTRKHHTGTFSKVLGSAGSAAAWTMPYGGTAGSAAARGAAIAGAEAASTIAANTKAKDEMAIQYQLASPGGAIGFGPKDDKAKATADGEDIVTPLVRKASEAIVAEISKK